jgi:hypothetical protein
MALVFAVFYAAPSWASAPMCDEHAQTISAPSPAIPRYQGEISLPYSCFDFRFGAVDQGMPLPHQPNQAVSLPAPDRALPFLAHLPPLPVSGRIPALDAGQGKASPGYSRDVFHPPCAR